MNFIFHNLTPMWVFNYLMEKLRLEMGGNEQIKLVMSKGKFVIRNE